MVRGLVGSVRTAFTHHSYTLASTSSSNDRISDSSVSDTPSLARVMNDSVARTSSRPCFASSALNSWTMSARTEVVSTNREPSGFLLSGGRSR